MVARAQLEAVVCSKVRPSEELVQELVARCGLDTEDCQLGILGEQVSGDWSAEYSSLIGQHNANL